MFDSRPLLFHYSSSEMAEIHKLDRVQIANYTRITTQFMENLLDGVRNGLTGTAE